MGKRGPKPGTGGRPKKPIAEKISEGNLGKRPLTVIDFKDSAADLEGQPMPDPPEYLSAMQKDGSILGAAEIYKKVWKWLAERGCASIVSPELIERYAMSTARWIQCEAVTSELGFLAKHPTTGQAIQSPYVSIANTYMNQATKQWGEIFQLVRENCTNEYVGNVNEDPMAQLLRARKGK